MPAASCGDGAEGQEPEHGTDGFSARSVWKRLTSRHSGTEADPWQETLSRQDAAAAARVAGLILSLGVALALTSDRWVGWLSVLLVVVAALVGDRLLPPRAARFVGPVEAGVVALALCMPMTTGMPVFIYFLIPPVAAGLRFGLSSVVVASLAQAAGLVAGIELWQAMPIGTAAVWLLTSLVLGVVGALSGGALSSSMSRIYASAACQERRRLSSEIHDGIAQDLAVLGHRVDMLLLDDSVPVTRSDVAAIGTEIRRVLQEARWSIHDLRGGRLPEVGLGTALADHVRRAAATADMTVHLKLTEGRRKLPTAVQMELLRIAQEAVTNARKHSGARNLWVELDASAGGALLRVSDDGGYTSRSQKSHTQGFGLTIMQERAQRIGAEFSYHPRPGGGTVVETRLVSSLRSPVNFARPRTHGETMADEPREVSP